MRRVLGAITLVLMAGCSDERAPRSTPSCPIPGADPVTCVCQPSGGACVCPNGAQGHLEGCDPAQCVCPITTPLDAAADDADAGATGTPDAGDDSDALAGSDSRADSDARDDADGGDAHDATEASTRD